MVGRGTPSLPAGIDRQTRLTIEKLAETNDIGAGLRGSPEERYIRVSDLINMGMAKRLSANAQRLVSGQNLISTTAAILDIPPRPTNLVASGGIGLIFLTWDSPKQLYSNHSLTEIWRATADNLGAATLIGQTTTTFLFQDPDVDHTLTYYYWIRFVSTSNITGPYNNSSGTVGITNQDPGELLAILQGEITESQLYPVLNERINLIDTAGTGLVDKVQDLETVFGSVSTAAASASAAVAAKVAAEIAAGNSQASSVSSANSATVALGHANASSTSATLAAGYKTDSESAATASQSSATSASTSAGNASTSAGSASTSASQASTSATNASGSASSAGASEIAAATSATNSGNSATASAGSATSAATSATNSGNSATASQVSRVASESARDTAQGHASAASTSATTASIAATNAGTSASSATTSSNTAITAAANALTYRNQAATSATDAEGFAIASAIDYTAINARLNNAGGTGVTVEQKLVATAGDVGGLEGQYTLKIDNNGAITGFGLSSVTVNGQANSTFIVNADKFAIVNSGGSLVVASLNRSGIYANCQTISGFTAGFSEGATFVLSGVYEAGWNGAYTINYLDSEIDYFEFIVPSTLAANPTSRILANGKPLVSLTRSGSTATATFLITPHNIVAGQTIDISSVDQSEWKGKYPVFATTGTTVSFTVPNSHATTATSSIRVALQTIPFVVSGGKVVMDGAYIKDASIGTAAIGNATITGAKIANASIGTAQIGTLNASVITAGTITTDRLIVGAATSSASSGIAYNVLGMSAASVWTRTETLATFISTGAQVWTTFVVNVACGEAFGSPAFPISTSVNWALIEVTPVINGVSYIAQRSTTYAQPNPGTGSNRVLGASISCILSPTLPSGSLTFEVTVKVSFYNSSGVAFATGGIFSVSANYFIQENKV